MIVYPHFTKITRCSKVTGKIYSKWEETINMPYPSPYTLESFEHYTKGKWLIVKLPSGDARWDLTAPYETEPEKARVEEEMAKITLVVEPEPVEMEQEELVTYKVYSAPKESHLKAPRVKFEVRDLVSNVLLAGNMDKGEADRVFKQLEEEHPERRLVLKMKEGF